jgi:hypothetical protein
VIFSLGWWVFRWAGGKFVGSDIDKNGFRPPLTADSSCRFFGARRYKVRSVDLFASHFPSCDCGLSLAFCRFNSVLRRALGGQARLAPLSRNVDRSRKLATRLLQVCGGVFC